MTSPTSCPACWSNGLTMASSMVCPPIWAHSTATLTRTFNSFIDDNVDIIIFGHSHQPLVKTEKGILMLNPGSITTKRFERWFSYIILELKIDGIKVNLEFIQPANS